MKKIVCLIVCLIFILTGCTEKEKETANNDLPKHHLFYFVNDYQKGTSSITDVNVASGDKNELINTTIGVSMIRYDDDKIYAIFGNLIGYIENNKIKYITLEDEYVSRYDVHNGMVYYGKNNTDASDDIFERFTMKDSSGKNEKIISDVGVSQLLIDDYIYYKPDSGVDVLKLVRYNLDGTNKLVIYDKLIGQLTKYGDYLYVIDYNDDNSLYRIKNDGSEIKKIVQGPLKLINANTNQIDGYTNMGVIDDYIYYINPNDGNKVYKSDGNETKLIVNESVTSIYIKDSYIYTNYTDYNKAGIYLLDKNGKEIQKITNIDPVEYIVN